MKLTDIMKSIVESMPHDWHWIPCWGGNGGPSYRGQWDANNAPHQGAKPDKWWLDRREHSSVGVLKMNASITIAAGLEWLSDFREPWANGFPDPKAHGKFADVFYNGSLVYRVSYVVVDGGRGTLPIPRRSGEKLLVPRNLAAFVDIIEEITGASAASEKHFARAGMTIVDEAWPNL